MSQATHTPSTSAPRPAVDALHALDAIHHAQRGVTALFIMASSHHECEGEAVNFVADALAAQLAIAERALGGDAADPTSEAQSDGTAEDPIEPPAADDSEGGVENPSVKTLYRRWRCATATPENETEGEGTVRNEIAFALECAMVTTPSSSGHEIRYKLEVLSDMHDSGTPIEPRSRVMIASIAGDIAGLLG